MPEENPEIKQEQAKQEQKQPVQEQKQFSQEQKQSHPEQKQSAPEQKQPGFRHIIRVANVDLAGEKQIRWAMTKIKGVGINFADAVCAAANIVKTKKAGNLSEQEIGKLNEIVSNPSPLPIWFFNRNRDYDSGEDKHLLTGTLSFFQENDIKRMKKIKCYRGVRHSKGLPVRGQRTRSNFRKSKGKVVGVAKKKIAQEKKESGKGKGDGKGEGKGEKKK